MKRLYSFSLAAILFLSIVLVPVVEVWASNITPASVVKFTNKERVDKGLPILWPNFELTQAAQNKANHMITLGYWEHYYLGKSPWDWMKEANYKFSAAGENLAIDFVAVEDIVQAWMDSPSHRQNIINSNFQEIGIGIAKGNFEGSETIIVVQMLGKPQADVNKEDPNVAGIYEVDESQMEAEQFLPTEEDLTQAEGKGIFSRMIEKFANSVGLMKLYLLNWFKLA